MDENEDIKTPSANTETACDSANPADPAAAGRADRRTKSELASIDSPTIAPAMTDMAAAKCPGSMRRRSSGPPSLPWPRKKSRLRSPNDPAPVSREVMLAVPRPHTPPGSSAIHPRRRGRAGGGVRRHWRCSRRNRRGAARRRYRDTPEPTALQTTLAQLRSRSPPSRRAWIRPAAMTGAQYSKLVERFDRVERAQSGANKSDRGTAQGNRPAR